MISDELREQCLLHVESDTLSPKQASENPVTWQAPSLQAQHAGPDVQLGDRSRPATEARDVRHSHALPEPSRTIV